MGPGRKRPIVRKGKLAGTSSPRDYETVKEARNVEIWRRES